ncbi:hypothetical protein BHE74_00015526 [Ensete ventricosum]|nr:hypothetical protein BHE74_00015526 [Ensete ventricosum]
MLQIPGSLEFHRSRDDSTASMEKTAPEIATVPAPRQNKGQVAKRLRHKHRSSKHLRNHAVVLMRPNGDCMIFDAVRVQVCLSVCDTLLVCVRGQGWGNWSSGPVLPRQLALDHVARLGGGRTTIIPTIYPSPKKEAPLRSSRRRGGGSFRHEVSMKEGFICI